jgi:hypothetical protein
MWSLRVNGTVADEGDGDAVGPRLSRHDTPQVIVGDDTDHSRGVFATDYRQHSMTTSEPFQHHVCGVIRVTVHQAGVDERRYRLAQNSGIHRSGQPFTTDHPYQRRRRTDHVRRGVIPRRTRPEIADGGIGRHKLTFGVHDVGCKPW